MHLVHMLDVHMLTLNASFLEIQLEIDCFLSCNTQVATSCVMLQAFPKNGPSRLAAIAFHGGIVSILGLYTLFWLKINLIQTLPWLLVLGIFTIVAGYNALSQQADSRLKQQ